MIRVAQASLRHPRVAIAIWLALAVGLGLLGKGIESRFSPSILVAKGTESARAEKLATSHFSDSVLMPIMLVGPAKELDKQGPVLARRLRARSDIRILSPWDGTPGTDVLRPRKTAATVVAAVQRPEKEVIETALPQIERTIDQSISGPVKVHVTGQASIDRAMRDETLDQTRIAVLIALPALLLALGFVLRAPFAALVVTAFTGSVLAIGYGLTAIAANLIRVDAIAVAGASMVGLALSAAFGLLVVSRFRDDLHIGTPLEAASETVVTAGRAVLIAGTAMVGAMILATTLSVTEILNSIGIGATLMAFVAAVGAVGVLPAAASLIGPRMEAGTFPSAPRTTPRRLKAGLPAVAVLAALVLMAALSAPLLSLGSGPPDAKLLPAGNQARQDYEAVARVMGPGWVSPFEIVVARHGAPVTTRQFLAKLGRFERTVGRDRAVDSVLGPGALVANANDLQGVPKGLNTAAKTATASKKDLKKLIAGLRLATGGVGQLRSGLGDAASGAGQLHGGSGQAYTGSAQLRAGLDQADAGAKQLSAGARQAAAGAKELAGGLGLAKEGVVGGLPAIDKLIKAVNSNAKDVGNLEGGAKATDAQIAAASSELAAMTVGRDDPHFTAVASGLQRAAAENDRLAAAITTAAVEAKLNATTVVVVRQQVEDLQAGINKLLKGGNELSAGLQKLSGGNRDLATGISQLDAGGAQLETGLRQLNDGAGQLATGLASGAGPSSELLAGMNTITGSVVKARKGIPSTKDLVKLRKEAPGLFDSGYFVLAAIDGAPRPARDAAAFLVNVEQGGFAGRITVVPEAPARADSTRALHDRLSRATARFARASHSEAELGGMASDLIDYRNIGLQRLPFVLVGIAALTVAILAIVTRSLVVPAVAVLLNLLTATTAFGVLTILFGGDSPPLGGPGFVDPVTMIAIVTVVLALSIDYEVFSLERLGRISATGVVMLAALLPFVGSNLTLIREFAIGMLVAVLVDSLFVRRLMSRIARRRTVALQGGERWHPQH